MTQKTENQIRQNIRLEDGKLALLQKLVRDFPLNLREIEEGIIGFSNLGIRTRFDVISSSTLHDEQSRPPLDPVFELWKDFGEENYQSLYSLRQQVAEFEYMDYIFTQHLSSVNGKQTDRSSESDTGIIKIRYSLPWTNQGVAMAKLGIQELYRLFRT